MGTRSIDRWVTGCRSLRRALGPSRREILRAGGLGLLGLNLPTLLWARAETHLAAPDPSFGRARACILLFMWGGPAQQETWDLKPDAPEQVRGEFRPIATAVPGIQISEHFPLLARQTDRLAIVRSVHHSDVNHTTATHELLTGRPIPRPGGGPPIEDWPHFGAVLEHLRGGTRRSPLPPYVQLRPEIDDGAPRFVEQSHGQGGGWLGPALAPFTIDHDPSRPDYSVGDFRLPAELAGARLDDRQALLAAVETQARVWEAAAPPVAAMARHHARAYDLLTDRRALEAFDLSREDPRLRARYGLHPHGQAVLQARRLVEAGVPIVTVFWQNDGITNVSVYWDTHNRNFVDLRERLMPPADQAFSALLDDLAARGLLDSTLVVWTGEFGRTPKVGQSVVGGAGAGRDGRDHWPHCFSTVLAGGGIRGGVVHGASDRWAAYPARDPVTPADIAATIYHCLGVDPGLELRDPLDRPLRLTLGEPIRSILV
jgi:hypothetical protein